MSKGIGIFLLLLTLVSCSKKDKIDEIEFAPYRWAFWPYPYDSTSKFTLKLSTFYSIKSSGKCDYLYEGGDHKRHYKTINLDKELLAEIISSIDEIKSDTIFGNNWEMLFYNEQYPYMYDGPSFKCIVHRGKQIQYITFIKKPFKPLEKLYLLNESVPDKSETLKDSTDLVSARNKLFRYIINNTEFIIPPPRPSSENESLRFVVPIVVDTIN